MGRIMDVHFNTVGYVENDRITDVHFITVGYIEGNRITDSSFNTVGYVEGEFHTAVGGAGLLLLL